MKKKGIIGTILAVYLLLAIVSPVLAGGLTVSGAKIETSVNPGEDYSRSMKISNTSDEPMDIMVEIKGYGMSADRDFIVLEPEEDESPYTARELMSVTPTDFHLEPGDLQTIDVVAKIPPEGGEGGRYAIVFIHTVPEEGSMISTITAVAARVLFTINGYDTDTSSEVTQISPVKAESQETTGLIVTLANNGNYHFKPNIQAKILDGDRVVATASVAPGWPVIPGYSRNFKLDFEGQGLLSAAEYKVDIEVKDESDNLLAGGTYPLEYVKGEEAEPSAVMASSPETSSPATPDEEQLPQETSTIEQSQPETPSSPESPATNWSLIGGVIAVVVVGLFVFFLVKRRA